MEQQKKQNSPTINQIYSSKKAIQILLSLSVLAFIFSQYSSLLSSSSSSLSSSFKLLSYSSTDRHYVFLLCNGIMLLVILSSGLFATTSLPGTEIYVENHVIRKDVQLLHHQPTDFSENINVKNNVLSHQSIDFKKNIINLQILLVPEAKAEISTEVGIEAEEAKRGITVTDQGAESMTPTDQGITEEEEEEEEVNDLLNLVDEQEEEEEEEFDNIEEEEEQGITLWSTEELNKKCDDFIRKMKYGIKYEAQLVMV